MTRKYGSAVAYALETPNRPTLTFCARCAWVATAMPFMATGRSIPATMEDAIAELLLVQVSAQRDEIILPEAVASPEGSCGVCERPFKEAA